MEPFTLCLALNIYHEARGEPVPGQIAVALVTLHRAKRRPDKICQVVYKPHQFSWTLYKSLPIREHDAWHRSIALAKVAWKFTDFTGGATHFHNDAVSPRWANELTYLGKIGNHHFYR